MVIPILLVLSKEVSNNGWTTGEISLRWLQKHFIPHTNLMATVATLRPNSTESTPYSVYIDIIPPLRIVIQHCIACTGEHESTHGKWEER